MRTVRKKDKEIPSVELKETIVEAKGIKSILLVVVLVVVAVAVVVAG